MWQCLEDLVVLHSNAEKEFPLHVMLVIVLTPLKHFVEQFPSIMLVYDTGTEVLKISLFDN